MIRIITSVEGAEAVCAVLERLPQAIQGACEGGLAEGMALVLDDVRALCPAHTGELKGSLAMNVAAAAGGAEGTVSAGSGHAAYVELGTYKMPAQPFLKPAFEANKGNVIGAVANAVKEAVG
ncbi:MAG: hypothetical protein RSB91_01545 [Clostridia bacterium]